MRVYGGSDYAVTADGGDYTVHIVVGIDPEGRMYLLDLWRKQTASAHLNGLTAYEIRSAMGIAERKQDADNAGTGAAARGIKSMAKRPKNHRSDWTRQELKALRQLAKENTPTRVIGLKFGRTAASIQNKATPEGISLKPTNQSPI